MIKTAIPSEKQIGPMSVFRGPALLGNDPLSGFPVVTCADFKLGWIKVIQIPYTTYPGTSEVELKSLGKAQLLLSKLGAKRYGAA